MIHPAPARRRHAAAATPPPRRRRHAAIATPPKPRCRSHTRHCHRAANATHAAATPWPTDVPRRRRHTARAGGMNTMNTMNTNSAALIRCCEYYVMNAVPGMNTIIKPVEYAHRPRHTDPPGPAQPPAPESEPPRPPDGARRRGTANRRWIRTHACAHAYKTISWRVTCARWLHCCIRVETFIRMPTIRLQPLAGSSHTLKTSRGEADPPRSRRGPAVQAPPSSPQAGCPRSVQCCRSDSRRPTTTTCMPWCSPSAA